MFAKPNGNQLGMSENMQPVIDPETSFSLLDSQRSSQKSDSRPGR